MSVALREGFARSAAGTRNAGIVVVVLMAVCGAFVFDQFAARISPAWMTGLLPWAALVAAVEAAAAESIVHRLPLVGGQRFSYRLSETIVLLLALKVVIFVLRGVEFAQLEIARYSREFWPVFFSGEYLGVLVLSLFAWGFSTRMTAHLIDLSLDEEILEEGARPSFTVDRDEVRIGMSAAVFTYGGLLAALAALTRWDMPALWRDAPVTAGGGWSVLVYFALGLVLFSLNQFSVLRGRWGWERTKFAPGITRAWLVYAVAAIGAVLLVAVLLPTGYGLDFFTTMATLVNVVLSLLFYLVSLLILPLLLLVAGLAGEETEPLENPFEDLAPQPELQPGEAALPSDPAAWLELARSTIFWVVFIGVTVYAMVQFARHNEVLWARLKQVPLLAGLGRAWEAFVRWLRGSFSAAAAGVQRGIRGVRERARDSVVEDVFGFVRLNRLSPRERMVFLYTALVRRAGEAVVTRGRGQTPDEFAQVLVGALPEFEIDIRGMTSAFERARYMGVDVSETDFQAMRGHWLRLRTALRERVRLSP